MTDSQYARNTRQANAFSYSGFWSRDPHNLAFGADLRRSQLNVLSQQDPRGTFTFTGAFAESALADFLLGIPTTSSIALGNADKYFRQSFYDAFVNDEWKINDSLTISVGVRWDYEPPNTELCRRLANLSIRSGLSAVAAVIGNDLIRPDRIGIQPRVGIAWHPNGNPRSLSVRATELIATQICTSRLQLKWHSNLHYRQPSVSRTAIQIRLRLQIRP